MKGSDTIIKHLNGLLAYELAAMDQYFVHSQMYLDWGLNKLYERIAHEFEDEKGHATKLIERMLFLEGKPDMVLRVEYTVTQKLKETIALCETEQDYVTRDMLMVLLDDTEMDHAYWLEQQLGLINRLGLSNYLQSQM
jgi:bacterioferritin